MTKEQETMNTHDFEPQDTMYAKITSPTNELSMNFP